MAVERVTPCAADYDMWTWRCSECASVVIMVEARIEDRAAVEERRNVARYAVTTPATIEFGSRAVACTVFDISATGAALNLENRPRLPKKFTLTAAGSALSCRAVWRKGKKIGLAFR
jgi:PilZ domain